MSCCRCGAQRDRHATGADALGVLLAGQSLCGPGQKTFWVGERDVDEVFLGAGNLALGEGQDRHEVDSAGQGLGGYGERVESCRSRKEKASGLVVGVHVRFDRVENIGDALVLVDEDSARPFDEAGRILGDGLTGRSVVKVEDRRSGAFGDLVKHRRLADRARSLQGDDGDLSHACRDHPGHPAFDDPGAHSGDASRASLYFCAPEAERSEIPES